MRISRPHLVACLVACVIASVSNASPRNWNLLPEVLHSDDHLTPSHNQVLVSGLTLGQHRIAFERTRWSDLQRHLGPLRIRRQGDASEAEDWTCFTVVTDQGQVQIWPHGGELQGGKYIAGVIAQAGTPWPRTECPVVNAGPGGPALDNGVWIGTAKAKLLRRLGKPTASLGAALIYDFEVALRDPKAGECSTFGRLIFEIRAGRVDRLDVQKNSAC